MAIIDNSLFQLNAPSASTPLGDTVYNHVSHHQAVYDELNSIEESLVQGYVRESASVSYNSSNSFIVAGDVTAIYTPGRIVRFSDGTTGVVSSSSYSSPNTIVNIVQGTVPSNLSYVDFSLQPKGGTNQFLKASGSDINTGTDPDKIVTPKAIADSYLAYSKYIGCILLAPSNSLAQSIPDNTFTPIYFNSSSYEVYDPYNWHDPSSNSERIVVPHNGIYRCYGAAKLNDSDTAGRILALFKNNNRILDIRAGHDGVGRWAQSIVLSLSCNANDYINLAVFQASGTTLTLLEAYFEVQLLVKL